MTFKVRRLVPNQKDHWSEVGLRVVLYEVILPSTRIVGPLSDPRDTVLGPSFRFKVFFSTCIVGTVSGIVSKILETRSFVTIFDLYIKNNIELSVDT